MDHLEMKLWCRKRTILKWNYGVEKGPSCII